MRKDTFDIAVKVFLRWLFRTRAPELVIFCTTSTILIALLGVNWFLKISGTSADETISVELGTTTGVPVEAFWIILLLCVSVMSISVSMAWKRFSADQDRQSRNRVLVIEARGLQDDTGSKLADSVSSDIQGHRHTYLLDLRQSADGVITNPNKLVARVQAMKIAIHQLINDGDRSETKIVYGGITPVPFTFLTGLLLDDEGSIIVMDWDRKAESWRTIDEDDDGQRFEMTGIENAGNSDDIVLAISASYFVRDENIKSSFTHPIVRLSMPNLESSHWSKEKQNALAAQFFETLKKLDAAGVKRIHMIIAAQNSVVFNLARRYDKRNLPHVIVYQYEQGSVIKYPWGVEMPVAGLEEARTIETVILSDPIDE